MRQLAEYRHLWFKMLAFHSSHYVKLQDFKTFQSEKIRFNYMSDKRRGLLRKR